MSLSVAVQMDPLDSINIAGDSTFALMLSCTVPETGTRTARTVGRTVYEYGGGRLWYQNSNCIWLACTERDDAPDGIVGRDADGHAISRNDLDAEAAHAPTQLSEHFVAGVALHAVKTAAVDRHHGALHVNQIVLAQSG